MIIRRYIFPLFRSIYFVLFFVACALSAAFWYFSPLITIREGHPFDAVIPRVVVISVIFLLFLTTMLIIFLSRRQRDKKMEDEITEPEVDPGEAMISAEMDELKSKFKKAMTELKKSKNGRKTLKDLPWYVIIGPPGAGKTTAIVNSGLKFPLAETLGKEAIGGVGGTRNCDWWFTNNAVLIDTAGRYTTQESDAEADNRAWTGFLGLMKKYRPRQPINGAIIAISLADLYMQDEMTQQSHARAVRRRLSELREQLGVRFPVYVLFTKADLIAGFTEYYHALGKEEREQVWGFTLPIAAVRSQEGPMAEFDAQFAALLERLNAQLLERMQGETDPQRRALVAGFPAQVASMRQVAKTFLEEVFQENRYEARQMLRGLYFTSGTQEGTPIDRLMLSMAQTFGIGRQAIGKGQGSGRSFFLTRLFEEVLFPEAGLVSADDKVERRYRWARRVAVFCTLVVASATGALWVRSYLGNVELIDTAGEQVSVYASASELLPASPIGDTDFPPVVEALNVLRDMPGHAKADDPGPDRKLTYGLYRGDVIGDQTAQTYRAALNQRFLPRLILRLEEQIAGSVNDTDRLFEALKVYLMLGLQGPINEDLIKAWLKADWENSYRGIALEGLRADLEGHLDALLSNEMQEVELNGPLIAQARDILSETPLAQRLYTSILSSEEALALGEWRLTDAGGARIKEAYVRSSGGGLTSGIPAIFTYDGFYNTFLPNALEVGIRAQSEAWVFGEEFSGGLAAAQQFAISRDVLALYYDDYIAHYTEILGDLDIIPMESKRHAVDVIRVLSNPSSPMRNVLTEINKETRLAEDKESAAAGAVKQGLGRLAFLETRTMSPAAIIVLQTFQNTGQSVQEEVDPLGLPVQRKFEWLNDIVQAEDGLPSKLDELLEQLGNVYNQLSRIDFTPGVQADDQIAAFMAAATRMEGPIPRWATQIADGSSGVAAEGTRAAINARWQTQVLPTCEQVLDNRYPFNRSSPTEVSMQDFTRVFGPSGLIDNFFNENLIDRVNTNTRPWSWREEDGKDLGMPTSVLEQLQFADQIKQAFFNGNPSPLVQFQMQPYTLGDKAKSAVLEIDGQSIEFRPRKGQPPPKVFSWPGPAGYTRLTLKPNRRDSENVVQQNGPWALFRMLDAAAIRARAKEGEKSVTIFVGDRSATYFLTYTGLFDPFTLPALSKFQCPKSF